MFFLFLFRIDLLRTYLIEVVRTGDHVEEQGQLPVWIRIRDPFLAPILQLEIPEELMAGQVARQGHDPEWQEHNTAEDIHGGVGADVVVQGVADPNGEAPVVATINDHVFDTLGHVGVDVDEVVLVETLQKVDRPTDGVDGTERTRRCCGEEEVQVDGDGGQVLQPVAAIRGEEPGTEKDRDRDIF